MDKIKTSIRRRAFSKNIQNKKAHRTIKAGLGVELYNPTSALLDEERISRAIWECLKNGDPEGVIEVIQIHLAAFNKTQASKKAHLPKTTLYSSFRSKNPTIRTLAKLVHACF
jgi:DNA-binding phage protein